MVESGTSESSERADVSRNSMVPWERFWCRRGDQPILHDDFLVERERSEWGASKQDVRLATLSELSRVPGLVLLGDPGTGKSFELKAEERRASNVAEGAERVVRLDLKSYTERTVERFVLDSPSVRGWSRGEHSLTLILDSLDECWRRVESLGPLLAEGLIAARPHGEAAPRLRLRLGCRGAEWRREIENALAKLFPEKTDDEASLQVWVIAPLTRRQALDYATVQLTVGSAFMVAVDQREVTALAAHPITLSMLVEGFKADGKLGGTRADVYESGLLRLCRDEHTSPGGARSSMHARQRLTVASRIAAVGVLSNRYLINGNFDAPPDGASFAMAAVGLVGYFWEPSAGDSVSCTQETLAETLRCGLFEGQAGQYRSWRHQSYAEFLAARYFNERRPPLDDVLALLCDRSRGHPRLHVQLEETACWLAGLWPELFTALMRDNADVFFRCDPARLSAEQRSELVRHFFDQLDRDEAETPHWGDQARLARLEHPGLEEQLGPILENVSGNWMLRDAALDIARACHVHALGSVALDRLLDPHEVPTIRSGAGMLLREVGDENLRAELKRRLTSETFTGSDEVRGHCLYLLWPEFLSVAELVELLVPETRDHTYGIYQDFRARRLPETIQAEHLPALLVWARRRVKAEAERDQRDELPERIALVALRHLNDSAVRSEFVMLLKECAEHYRALLGHNKVVLASDAALRHGLWHTIVTARISVIDSLGSVSLRDSGLWNHDDLPWLVAQAEAAATSGDRQEWCHAVFQLFDFSQATHVECVWPCVERFPEFASYWLTRTASRLPDDEKKNWEKRNYYRTQREQKLEADRKARAKPLVVHVDEMLAAFASGKTGAMWWLNIRLSGLVVAEREDGGGFPRRGLMEGAAWQALPTEAQERVLDAACTFLMEVPVEPEKVLHRATIFVLYSASARFLCLIFLRRPQWIDERDREFWKKWALVLVAYQSRSGESKDATWGRVARLAFARAREEFLDAMRMFFSDRRDDSGLHEGLEVLDDLPPDFAVDEIVFEAAQNRMQTVRQAQHLFSWLLTRKHLTTEIRLAAVASAERTEYCDCLAPVAAGLLLALRTGAYGTKTLGEFERDPEWGTRVLATALACHGREKAWTGEFSSALCVQLWQWLNKHHPGDPYRDRSDGSVRLEHNLYHLRNGLLSAVAARGTLEAVAALADLARQNQEPWIGQILANARRAQRRMEWNPPSSGHVMKYFSRRENPPLSTDADLAEAIIASLRRYEATLRGRTPVTELWNIPAGPVKHSSPRDEENFSNCIARHLEEDLKDCSVAVARESETREQLGSDSADWPDLVVTAPSADESNRMLWVIVEVKGAWNAKIPASMESQLLERYLRAAPCGIYLAGWFSCAAWNAPGDDRRTRGWCARSVAELTLALVEETTRLSERSGKWIRGVVLDGRLG